MDFDTTSNNGKGRRFRGFADFSTGSGAVRPGPQRRRRSDPDGGAEGEGFRIPAGSRKAALVHLGLAAWRAGRLDSKRFGEVRGREVDEAGLQRALYRSSIGEIEYVLGTDP